MWPSPSDYQDAIQNPRLCFEMPELREAEAARGALGLPRVASGNFASVYELRSPRRRWAVRCFLRPVSDQERRYHAISEYLNTHPLRWLVDFDYHPRGIRTRGGWYPIVTMDWVDGEPLHRHVETLLGNRSSLLALAYQWRGLARDVRGTGCAHGDYQHGNVLVTSGELRLVDYDGMFVPAFAGEASPELGRPNYQHPSRSSHDYGPELDNFSAFVIYLSLRALALAPDLWEFHDGENLVLTAADFRDPASSKALARMRAIDDVEVRALAGQFGALRAAAPCEVPPLEQIVAAAAPAWFIGRPAEPLSEGRSSPTAASRPTHDPRPTTHDPAPETRGKGPEWWTDRGANGATGPARSDPASAPAAARAAASAPSETGSRWWRTDRGAAATAPSAGTDGPSLAAPPAAQGGPSLAAPSEARLSRPQPAADSPLSGDRNSPKPAKPPKASKPAVTPKAAAKRPAPTARTGGRAPALPSPRRATAGAALLGLLLTAAGGLQPQALTGRVVPWSDLRPATAGEGTPERGDGETIEAKSPDRTAPDNRAPKAPPQSSTSRPVELYRGRVLLRSGMAGERIASVLFRLDGQIAYISDRPPFVWEWNTLATPDDEHVLEILARDEGGALVDRRVLRVRVANSPAPAASGKVAR
jgi:hypothetical protein